MKWGAQERRHLRWPLLLAIVLCGAGVAMVLYSEYRLDSARQERAAARKQSASALERVAKVAEEERDIRNNLVVYQRMVDAGIVGEKNRLDLIDGIAAIKTARKLFDIRYQIEPQKPLDYPGIARTPGLDFVVSRVQLDMQLLHEEDLLRFIRDLTARGQYHLAVRSCSLGRHDRSPASAFAPNVQARCTLDLINLVEARAS